MTEGEPENGRPKWVPAGWVGIFKPRIFALPIKIHQIKFSTHAAWLGGPHEWKLSASKVPRSNKNGAHALYFG